VAARTDLEELPEVRRHVEGEPVKGHAAPHRKSDRCDFLAADPHAAVRSLPGRLDPEVAARPDQDFLEVRDELLHLQAVREFEDGIADQLSRPVVRRLATAFHLDDLEARVEDVLPLPAASQRCDRLVLDQDESVRDPVVRPPIDERLLPFPDLAVGPPSKVE